MKLGPKLVLIFVATAVLPLTAAAVVFLDATRNLGGELVERGRSVLEERIRADIRRTVEETGISVAEDRKRLEDRLRFLAAELADRLSAKAPPKVDLDARFITPANGAGMADGDIDLERFAITLADDAPRDTVKETLGRLAGTAPVSRTIYFRDRGVVAWQHLVLDSGLTVTFPGTKAPAVGDLRESDWYFAAIESNDVVWSGIDTKGPLPLVGPASVVQRADGTIAGVVALRLRVPDLLARALPPSRLPPDAIVYLAATEET